MSRGEEIEKGWLSRMLWEPSSMNLRRLDEERFRLDQDLASLCFQVDANFPSKVTLKRMQQRIVRIRRDVHAVRLRTNFDSILREDILSTVDVVDAYLDHQFFWDKARPASEKVGIDDFLRTIYGLDVPAFLRRQVPRMDHAAQDAKYRLGRTANDYQFPSTYAEVQKKIHEYCRKVPNILKQFLEETNLDLSFDDVPIKILLSGGGSGGEYHNDLFLIKLDPDGIKYYKGKDDSVHVQRVVFLLDAIHEVGHMLNDRHGPLVPKGVQFHAETRQFYVRDVTIEGLARWTEEVGLGWISKNRAALDISEKEVEVGRLSLKANMQNEILPSLYTILRFHELEGRTADANECMAAITGIPAMARNAGALLSEHNLEELVCSLNTIIGFHHVKRLAQRIETQVRTRYGEEFLQKYGGWLARGLYIGAFRPKTHKRFVLEEYVPRTLEYIMAELEHKK